MYEKIKTVMFGDTEVTIYKNILGEYFAEYEDGYHTKKIPCGDDFQFIWEHLSNAFGGGNGPEGYELLNMADEIENKYLAETTTCEIIDNAIDEYIFKHNRLFPAYIHEELASILRYRYGRMSNREHALAKLSAISTVEDWLENAITSERIYRLDTDEDYEEQAVRIIGAYKMGLDYMVEFAILDFDNDDKGGCIWVSNETFSITLSSCRLTHRRADELPPEYEEVL